MPDVFERLAMFHKKMQKVRADSKNPHFNSNFTSLEALFDAVRAPLAEVGLDFTQPPAPASQPAHIAVRTVVFVTDTDCDGAGTIEGTLEMPLAKRDGHAAGSAMKYARRYSLASVLGIVDGVDDDANACSVVNPVSAAKRDQVVKAFKKAGIEVEGGFPDPMSKEDYDRFLADYKAAKEVAG